MIVTRRADAVGVLAVFPLGPLRNSPREQRRQGDANKKKGQARL